MNELSISGMTKNIASLASDAKSKVIESAHNEIQAEKGAKDFEAVLLNKLMEEMDRSIQRSGLFEGATSGQVRSMFWHFMSEEIAEQGGLGLWKQLKGQLQAYGESAEMQQTPQAPSVEHSS